MKIFQKTIISIFLIITMVHAQVPIPKSGSIGNLSPETWTTGNTYWIVGNISVINLTIEPGVIIEFIDQYNFSIDGEFSAHGTFTDSIIFRPASTNTNGWNGILVNSAATLAHLSFCRITGANNQGVYIAKDNVFELNNSEISHTNGNGIVFLSGGAALKGTIKNSIINDNTNNGIYLVKGNINVYNSLIIDNDQAGFVTTQNQDKLNIFNCVIADNEGTGIVSTSANGPVNIVNSIIYDNATSLNLTTNAVSITYSNIEGVDIYPGEGNVKFDPAFADTITYQLAEGSFCIDLGNPIEQYNDIYFPPSKGTTRNDMGAYGGPLAGEWFEKITVESNLIDFEQVGISAPLQKDFKLKNFTKSPVNVSDISFSGTDASYFSIIDTNFTIASQDSYTTQILFSPDEERIYNAAATIINDLGIIKINLTGEGLVPVIELSQLVIDFDSLIVNQDSVQQLIITNTGKSDLIVYKDSLKIAGTDSTQFSLGTLESNLIIPASNSEMIDIFFAPTDSGKKEAVLNIYTNDPINHIKQVALKGVGIKPAISVSDSSLDFGIVEVEQDSSQQVKIYNTGTADLIIYKNSLEIAGVNAADFSYEQPDLDLIIPAGDSLDISLNFAPSDSGHKEATLKIYSNDVENSPLQIALTGQGHTKPLIRLAESLLEFGTLALQEDSLKKLTIYNDGTADLIIYKDSLNISSNTSLHFYLDSWQTDLTIAKKDSEYINVYFSPIDSGQHEAILNIVSNDIETPHKEVALTGYGFVKSVPVIHTSKTELNFGETIVTQHSDMELVIYNIGMADLNIVADDLKITGIDSAAFYIGPISETPPISFGDSLVLSIRFTPTDSGGKTAYLNIISNDTTNSPLQILLSGSGKIIQELLPVINVSQSQLNFDSVIINRDSTQQLTIFNKGSSNLIIFKDQLKINGSGASLFSLEEIATDIHIPKDDSAKIGICFTPTDTAAKTAMLAIQSNDVNNTPKNVTLSGSGILDPIASIEFNEDVTSKQFIKGQDIILGYNISAAASIDSAFIYYKIGGKSDYTRISLTNSESNTWQTTIDGNDVTERGLEYYVESHHRRNITKNAQKIISVQVPLLNFPEETLQNKYQLISIPIDVDQQIITDLLGDDLGTYDDTKYRIFNYIEDSGYVELSSLDKQLEQGKAVWLITKNKQTLDIENGRSVTTATDFEINLKAGWNMIGSPFAFPVSWNLVDTNHALRFYDGSDWPFKDVLEPYKGYAVKVESDTTILVPPIEYNSLLKNTDGVLAGSEWHFQISGNGQNVFDQYNYAGVKQNATNGIDKNDHAEPPPIGEFISISFVDDKFTGRKYSTDFREKGLDGYTFNLNVESNISAQKVLQFIPENLPENFDWQVISPQLKIIYNKNNITISNNQKLQLIVGTKQYINNVTDDYKNIPTKISLKQNYPNPFNPETTISFELTDALNVKIDIYNILGKHIKTLVDNQVMDAGYHKIKWNSLNHLDHKVSSSIYFLHFKAGHFTKTIKMIMSK